MPVTYSKPRDASALDYVESLDKLRAQLRTVFKQAQVIAESELNRQHVDSSASGTNSVVVTFKDDEVLDFVEEAVLIRREALKAKRAARA